MKTEKNFARPSRGLMSNPIHQSVCIARIEIPIPKQGIVFRCDGAPLKEGVSVRTFVGPQSRHIFYVTAIDLFISPNQN